MPVAMAGQGFHTDDDWRPRPAERSYTFGDFCLLPDRQVLLKDAQPVALGSRAFDILTLLVQRAGELVSNGEIEAYAWPATYVHESNVKVHIAALRKTLRGAGDDGRAILNVPGRGYCFAGPVKVEGRARPSAARATAARAAAPTPSTSVIGREDEIAALADLVAQHRLVTIVGAGGVGKTTLAWAAADRLADAFDAPPCFVDLASIDDPQLVVDAIAAALGVRVDLNDVLGGIAAHLRETARLVILDNCEHLTAAVAAVADQLATGAGRSSLLATSREPLRARREMAWRLAPLACPAADAPITAALALNYSAVALFSARAGERAGYVPTDEDAATVGAICRRLDGVPLALELAATRLDSLSPADLLELLQISLAPLGQDDVATPIRHRTLLATLDWSYRLLSDTEAAIGAAGLPRQLAAHMSDPVIQHHKVAGVGDRVAYGFVKVLRFFADTFFARRYGNRAVVLETVAAVPGMVAGMLIHLRRLRRMEDDHGWIKTLLDEAENERMHLMTFIEVCKPSLFERFVVVAVQWVFYLFFFGLYLVSAKTAHRVVGYFEEEAVISYTHYLAEIDAGRAENVPAPALAIRYWSLPADARLREVVVVVRDDEAHHRDVNHGFANAIAGLPVGAVAPSPPHAA